jgi:alkylation response protein AidB-like acyl-CoA dehydrogenase
VEGSAPVSERTERGPVSERTERGTELLYDETETDVRGSVRDMLATRSPVSQVLARVESGAAYDVAVWRTLASGMGLAGVWVPERFGGGGASLREAAVVLEELGRAVTPVPYLSSAVVATAALLASSDGELLARLAAGEAVAALAVPFTTAPSTLAAPAVTVADGRLTGRITGVADGLAADVLLVSTVDGLYAVDAAADGVRRDGVVSLDLTRPLADIGLDGAAGRLVVAGDAARAAVAHALTVGAALLASEQLGVAEWCLDTTVEYVKLRHQFARPIGSFQAIKHRLADLWVAVTQARAVARYAAHCAATADPDLPTAAALAQAYVSPVAVRAAEECVQLHGGIGFTWEHPAHLFLKRAKADSLAFGTADRHRAALAVLVDLPA